MYCWVGLLLLSKEFKCNSVCKMSSLVLAFTVDPNWV